jgi:hypothetical protein
MKKAPPPVTVAVAAGLLLAYGVLSLVRLWIFGNGLPSSLVDGAVWAVSLLVFAVIARCIYRGSNAMRWLVTAAVAAAVVLMPIYKPEMPLDSQLPMYLLQYILPVLATVLMFTRSAKRWFKP